METERRRRTHNGKREEKRYTNQTKYIWKFLSGYRATRVELRQPGLFGMLLYSSRNGKEESYHLALTIHQFFVAF